MSIINVLNNNIWLNDVKDRKEKRKEYRERYLRSSVWADKSKAAKERDGYVCQRCGKRGNDAHHKKYPIPPMILGDEPIDWLETLCRDCHNKDHF